MSKSLRKTSKEDLINLVYARSAELKKQRKQYHALKKRYDECVKELNKEEEPIREDNKGCLGCLFEVIPVFSYFIIFLLILSLLALLF